MRLTAGTTILDIICGGLVCLIVFTWTIYRKSIPKGLMLPPGPPGKFIIGNLMDMPRGSYWETFDRWAKEHGDLVHVRLFGQSILFVNSLEVARDLFDKRSSIYSDRGHSHMITDLIGWDWNMASMPYGDCWRRHRKIAHQCFHPRAVVKYHDVQIKQSRIFLQRLHDTPEEFLEHIRHFAGAIIMEIVYGIKVLPKGDPYIEVAETGIKEVSDAGVFGKYLVEVLPLLKYVPEWMPGAGFRRKANEVRELITDMAATPFAAVKDALDAGTAQPSITATLLEDLPLKHDAPADEESLICNVAGVAYAAGADTTVSTLSSFILAMVLYPDVQRKAQSELDSVIGNRLPVPEDLECLPYVHAVCKEAYRWHPALPLGIPHRVTQDDVYGDYFIPKGSIVIGNSWTILHNEKTYGPNPQSFEPDRFFRPGAIDPVGQFGFGRRICPGRYMADITIFLMVASFLKVFNILPGKDDKGEQIPIKPAFNPGILSHVEPFRCTIRPRSKLAKALILAPVAD